MNSIFKILDKHMTRTRERIAVKLRKGLLDRPYQPKLEPIHKLDGSIWKKVREL